MNNDENTFGDYTFEEWVPEKVRGEIIAFWGWAGRTWKDWVENGKHLETETCKHGPGPNGFGNPPYGATAEYFFADYHLSKEHGKQIFKIVRGRYIHAWNNIGRLIDEDGATHHPSSCDRWVRVYV